MDETKPYPSDMGSVSRRKLIIEPSEDLAREAAEGDLRGELQDNFSTYLKRKARRILTYFYSFSKIEIKYAQDLFIEN